MWCSVFHCSNCASVRSFTPSTRVRSPSLANFYNWKTKCDLFTYKEKDNQIFILWYVVPLTYIHIKDLKWVCFFELSVKRYDHMNYSMCIRVWAPSVYNMFIRSEHFWVLISFDLGLKTKNHNRSLAWKLKDTNINRNKNRRSLHQSH